jgi:glycine/D-amino acid oxidase-like deaminating enzyme
MPKFLIIGHGLAGAVLAHTLLSKGKEVMVIDQKHSLSASSVSVGLVNPLIGPKLNLPIHLVECLKTNQLFYGQLEQRWEKDLYTSLALHRIFKSEKQKSIWKKKSTTQEFAAFFGKQIGRKEYEKVGIQADYGGGITRQTFRLDVSGFLSSSKEYLESIDSWSGEKFDLSKWPPQYKIIFCEGHRVLDNPWFNYLPFAPARGEVLTVQSDQEESVSNGTWFLPNSRGQAKIGSTWDHENLSLEKSDIGKIEILENCIFFPSFEFKILQHSSGVRSGTKDRNPMIGRHPNHSNLFLFNGFGSRGTSTIPYYANHMANFLLQDQELPQDANLNRFKNEIS